MEQLTRTFRWLDYGVGLATLGYGVYVGRPIYALAGVAGLVLARMNLAERISNRLKAHFLRKRSSPAGPLPEIEQAAPARPSVGNDYGKSRLAISASLSFSSPHSLLRSSAHLNHASQSHPKQ